MLNDGEIIRVSELKNNRAKSWIIILTKDKVLSTHLGQIIHNDIIGGEYGDILSLTKGKVVILSPTPRDYLLHFR